MDSGLKPEASTVVIGAMLSEAVQFGEVMKGLGSHKLNQYLFTKSQANFVLKFEALGDELAVEQNAVFGVQVFDNPPALGGVVFK